MVEKEKKNHSKQVSLGCLSSPIHSGCYMDCMNSFLHNNIQKKIPLRSLRFFYMTKCSWFTANLVGLCGKTQTLINPNNANTN